MSEAQRSSVTTPENARRDITDAEAFYRTTQQSIRHIEARDRFWIARWIVVIFVGTVLIALATFSAEGFMTGKWDDAAMRTSDLVRSGILPVVTLVLGYYFGRSAIPVAERSERMDAS